MGAPFVDGRRLDDLTVELEDSGLTAIDAVVGLPVMVVESNGGHSAGVVEHDGRGFVVRIWAPMYSERCQVRRRGVGA